MLWMENLDEQIKYGEKKEHSVKDSFDISIWFLFKLTMVTKSLLDDLYFLYMSRILIYILVYKSIDFTL